MIGTRSKHVYGQGFEEGMDVVRPSVEQDGYRTVARTETPRNGQQSVVAIDIIALMDALGIRQPMIAGFDWGARTANIIAALWPERCKALVSVSGYLIGSQQAGKVPLPPSAELQWWYQFYFATDRGKAGSPRTAPEAGAAYRNPAPNLLAREVARAARMCDRVVTGGSDPCRARGCDLPLLKKLEGTSSSHNDLEIRGYWLTRDAESQE
jgi:pimeloyl-ACP methyl ester carboxylesterase